MRLRLRLYEVEVHIGFCVNVHGEFRFEVMYLYVDLHVEVRVEFYGGCHAGLHVEINVDIHVDIQGDFMLRCIFGFTSSFMWSSM